MVSRYDGFKSFTGWSEAHCIYQLCAWLDKSKLGYDCLLNWEITAQEMLNEYSDKNSNAGGWTETGKGVSAHGVDGEYRWMLEINEVEEVVAYHKKVRFYISIAN